MALTILDPGIQATLQAMPRAGFRHQGVPAAGPVDELSAALVTRVVGNPPDAALLEITSGPFRVRIDGPATFAVGGAEAEMSVNGRPVAPWSPLTFGRGARELHIGPAVKGMRFYLALRGGLQSSDFLGSSSTYLPAGFGGLMGRALIKGDCLEVLSAEAMSAPIAVPAVLHPFMGKGWSLRATEGAEADWLTAEARELLFGAGFTVSAQSSRMGIRLDDVKLEISDRQLQHSVPVFPGTVQCPPGGQPVVLSADAQTTGGYPRIAQIIRADRHRIGQMSPGHSVTFVRVSAEEATDILRTKKAALAAFLGT